MTEERNSPLSLLVHPLSMIITWSMPVRHSAIPISHTLSAIPIQRLSTRSWSRSGKTTQIQKAGHHPDGDSLQKNATEINAYATTLLDSLERTLMRLGEKKEYYYKHLRGLRVADSKLGTLLGLMAACPDPLGHNVQHRDTSNRSNLLNRSDASKTIYTSE